MLKYNTETNTQTVEVFKSMSLHLVQTIKHRTTSLQEADLKDPLIDLEPHDVIDIVRVYGVLAAQQSPSDFTPKLFLDDQEGDDDLEAYSSTRDVRAMSLEVMKILQPSILLKLDNSSLSNISDILFTYSQISPTLLDTKQLNFVGKLEKAIVDKISTKDYFNTLNSTKIMWALSRHYNKDRAPNQDACDVII